MMTRFEESHFTFTKPAGFFSVLAAALFALFLTACNERPAGVLPAPETISQDEAASRLVSRATSGILPRNEPIRIRFTEEAAGPAVSARPLPDGVFSFSPSIRGRVLWEDSRTLAFVPKENLEPRRAYRGTVNLEAVLGKEAAAGKTVSLYFSTRGREVESLETDLRPVEAADPFILEYRGTLVFSEAPDKNVLEKAARLDLSGRPVAVAFKEGKNSKSFHFVSEPVARDARRGELTLSLDGKTLELPETFVRRDVLESKDRVSLVSVEPADKDRAGSFKLVFSDDLASDQRLDGLIRVEPSVKTSLRRQGRTVLLTGDFRPGNRYVIKAASGIRSRRGTRTDAEASREIEVEDVKPEISFVQAGAFLPTSGDRKIFFRTVNLRRARVEVKRVFENNLGQFIQTEQLSSARTRNRDFNYDAVHRVGVVIARDLLEIGEQKNIPLVSELDLRRLVSPKDRGVYLVSLSFERDDMIWDFDSSSRDGNDYYTNPASNGYLWARGRIYKPLIVTDLGLTWKAGQGEHTIFTTDLLSAAPARGVFVRLMTYQNQPIAEGYTDNDGRIVFSGVREEAFSVTAEKDGMRSVLKSNEMAWNLSGFDTGGADFGERGTRAYLYTDRGVYRPGDAIHLSALVRNQDGTFPDGHPVTLKVMNPRGQETLNETSKGGTDGFYSFSFSTKDDDPTGAWNASLTAGGSVFSLPLRIETIVPNRLKVLLDTEPKRLSRETRDVKLLLSSVYLFGAPASGLNYEIGAKVFPREMTFPSHPGFFFSNEGSEYSPVEFDRIKDVLDAEGKAQADWSWSPEDLGEPPSGLYLQFDARVFEKGGRAVRETKTLPLDPYAAYVGIQKPDFDYGYARVGDTLQVPFVLLSGEGSPVPGKTVAYRLYRNARSWWWEYDSVESFRVRYKSDIQTTLVKEGTAVSKGTPVALDFTPDTWGEYFLEVEAPGEGTGPGHRAGFFFRASSWSDQTSTDNEGVLAVKPDRPVYYPGDRARITLATPSSGYLLVSVERGSRLLSASWRKIERNETVVEIPITRDMVPNAYLSVSLLQPHGASSNDRPLRVYGIAALRVEDPATRESLVVEAPDVLRPNQDFTVSVKASSGGTQFTLAVVDEGLLDLTRFPSPDAWKDFYAKQRLGVATLDIYSQVIGLYKDDIFRTFAIGGGEEAGLLAEGEASAKKEDSKAKRFKPVALFSGVLKTDERGRGKAVFSMPNYMGSVRIMALSAKGERYGSASKTVPVRSSIVLLPSLPRVLGPGEKIRMPASVFVLEDGIGEVAVSVKTEGPVRIAGPAERRLKAAKGDEAEASFEIETLNAVGPAKITVTAKGGGFETNDVTDIVVRASSPRLYRSEQASLHPGERRTLSVDTGGLPGTNRTRFTVQKRGDLKLGNRLAWLIQYPYGCIEQTTSAVFPQLYLRDFLPGGAGGKTIDANIDAGIAALKRFQTASGGFAYWPGQPEANPWGTNYAGHFMLEARALGHPVPQEMFRRWLSYQENAAAAGRDGMETRIYRLYLLARAGKPAVGPMNLIKETASSLKEMETWMLAAAFKLAGMERTAYDLASTAGIEPGEYVEFAGTYGSDLRDRAMILEAALILGLTDTADRIFDVVADHVSGNAWYSTQTLGYSLLSMGKYLEAMKSGESFSGTVVLPSGERKRFAGVKSSFTIDLPERPAPKQEVTVEIDSAAGTSRVFALLEWEGQPLVYSEGKVSENFDLQIDFRNNDGDSVNPAKLEQGTELWEIITLSRPNRESLNLEELALDRILPSGWEPVNLRLTGEALPSWLGTRHLAREEYLDIRDDRIIWFFDMPRNVRKLVFAAKYQAVTEGIFRLPPLKLQAMYRNDYRAVEPGFAVEVTGRK